tara:strand:- start:384 stop:539 length:156 start_codon:yes stop_codon:yes gene_type:complete
MNKKILNVGCGNIKSYKKDKGNWKINLINQVLEYSRFKWGVYPRIIIRCKK